MIGWLVRRKLKAFEPQWKVSDITGTCALVTIFTMGAFAVLA